MYCPVYYIVVCCGDTIAYNLSNDHARKLIDTIVSNLGENRYIYGIWRDNFNHDEDAKPEFRACKFSERFPEFVAGYEF